MDDSLNGGSDQAAQPAPRPNPDLKILDRLVGTWRVSGEAEGTVTYEWADGGFFLLQHVNLGGSKGLEVIGHEHKYGEEPGLESHCHRSMIMTPDIFGGTCRRAVLL